MPLRQSVIKSFFCCILLVSTLTGCRSARNVSASEGVTSGTAVAVSQPSDLSPKQQFETLVDSYRP
ncbi:MAG: hypothetical protein K2M77_02030, partial [Muribaculaceae bacterium]|nr:hypothetical protein [Muribaculaceae bacterium]